MQHPGDDHLLAILELEDKAKTFVAGMSLLSILLKEQQTEVALADLGVLAAVELRDSLIKLRQQLVELGAQDCPGCKKWLESFPRHRVGEDCPVCGRSWTRLIKARARRGKWTGSRAGH